MTILKAGSARTYATNEKLDLAFIGAGGRACADISALFSQKVIALFEVGWAGPLTEAVLPGTVALRSQLREKVTRTKLRWDSKNLKYHKGQEGAPFVGYDYPEG